MAGLSLDIKASLDPDFLWRLLGCYDACVAHGLRLRATEGYRSPTRSDELYHAWVAGGKVGPRAAPGGSSAHNYGMAVDFAALDADGRVIGSSAAPEYGVLQEIAERYGLKTLRALNDGGHVELDGWEDRIKFLDVESGSSTK